MNPIQLQWTTDRIEEAQRVAKRLVQERLAACVQIMSPMESYFVWEGKVDRAKEVKVVVKTDLAHFEAVQALIQEETHYDVPEILYISIDGGNPSYLAWMESTLHP